MWQPAPQHAALVLQTQCERATPGSTLASLPCEQTYADRGYTTLEGTLSDASRVFDEWCLQESHACVSMTRTNMTRLHAQGDKGGPVAPSQQQQSAIA